MSRRTVRAAVAAFVGGGSVTNLNTVHRAQPRVTGGTDFGLSNNAGSGAVAWIYIEGESERRIAVGGPTSGIKEITYQIGVVIDLRSVKDSAEAAQDDFDDLIESLKGRLRSDRQLGTAGQPNPVFVAGEGAEWGGPDLEVLSDMPKQNKSEVWIKGVVRVAVVENVFS